jgi:hypothetical protein
MVTLESRLPWLGRRDEQPVSRLAGFDGPAVEDLAGFSTSRLSRPWSRRFPLGRQDELPVVTQESRPPSLGCEDE